MNKLDAKIDSLLGKQVNDRNIRNQERNQVYDFVCYVCGNLITMHGIVITIPEINFGRLTGEIMVAEVETIKTHKEVATTGAEEVVQEDEVVTTMSCSLSSIKIMQTLPIFL